MKSELTKQESGLDFALLASLYTSDDADKVRAWLSAYPDAVEALIDAYPVINNIFGEHLLRVELEVVKDRDANGSPELFACIHTDQDAHEALQSLDRFDDEWFLEHSEVADGKLNFNLYFV